MDGFFHAGFSLKKMQSDVWCKCFFFQVRMAWELNVYVKDHPAGVGRDVLAGSALLLSQCWMERQSLREAALLKVMKMGRCSADSHQLRCWWWSAVTDICATWMSRYSFQWKVRYHPVSALEIFILPKFWTLLHMIFCRILFCLHWHLWTIFLKTYAS